MTTHTHTGIADLRSNAHAYACEQLAHLPAAKCLKHGMRVRGTFGAHESHVASPRCCSLLYLCVNTHAFGHTHADVRRREFVSYHVSLYVCLCVLICFLICVLMCALICFLVCALTDTTCQLEQEQLNSIQISPPIFLYTGFPPQYSCGTKR